MIVGEHGCHDAISQRAVGKMANLLLVTLEAMLTAMEILEQKALEIAEAVENERVCRAASRGGPDHHGK